MKSRPRGCDTESTLAHAGQCVALQNQSSCLRAAAASTNVHDSEKIAGSSGMKAVVNHYAMYAQPSNLPVI